MIPGPQLVLSVLAPGGSSSARQRLRAVDRRGPFPPVHSHSLELSSRGPDAVLGAGFSPGAVLPAGGGQLRSPAGQCRHRAGPFCVRYGDVGAELPQGGLWLPRRMSPVLLDAHREARDGGSALEHHVLFAVWAL